MIFESSSLVTIILPHRTEARASLVQVEVIVSHHIRCGIAFPQLVDESHQSGFLKECARVAGTALLVQSPFVTDAYRMGIVPLAVRTHL